MQSDDAESSQSTSNFVSPNVSSQKEAANDQVNYHVVDEDRLGGELQSDSGDNSE
jgi:hypothetical protein